MDRSGSLIALTLVLLVACLTCNCEPVPSESYLDFPTDFSTEFHRNIASALKKIVIKDPYPSMELFAIVIEKAQREADSETDRQVYTDLIELRTKNFEGRLERTFLSICAQADHDPNSGLKPWKDYLTNLDDRFRFTLSVFYNFKQYITDENIVIESKLDQVFAAAFNMRGDIRVREAELAKKLSEFDLTTDKSFNARNMINKIRKITGDKSTANDFILLKKFMLGHCSRLMAHVDLSRIISRMDLLRYLNYKMPTEPFAHTNLKLFDEYNRLCLALRKPTTSELIRDNLNKRLRRKWLCI